MFHVTYKNMLMNIFYIQASKLMNKWLFIMTSIVFVHIVHIYFAMENYNGKFSFEKTYF